MALIQKLRLPVVDTTSQNRTALFGLSNKGWEAFGFLLLAAVVVTAISIVLYIAYKYAIRVQGNASDFGQVFYPFLALFDVNREYNVPSLFASSLWAVSAVLSWVIANTPSCGRKPWIIFGIICIYFSIDEAVSIHETVLGGAAEAVFGLGSGLLHFIWIIPGSLLAVIAVALSLKAVLQLPRPLRGGMLIAGFLFLFGALGLEAASGLALEIWGDEIRYKIITWGEELLEMIGVSLLIAVLVSVISTNSKQIILRRGQTV